MQSLGDAFESEAVSVAGAFLKDRHFIGTPHILTALTHAVGSGAGALRGRRGFIALPRSLLLLVFRNVLLSGWQSALGLLQRSFAAELFSLLELLFELPFPPLGVV